MVVLEMCIQMIPLLVKYSLFCEHPKQACGGPGPRGRRIYSRRSKLSANKIFFFFEVLDSNLRL